MRWAAALLFLFLLADAPEPAIRYFSNVRDLRVAQADRQNYFVIDQEIWAHARPDLGDLRLYDGESPVQYALSEQREESSTQEVEAKIMNLGNVAGHTEFDLDMQGLQEYDRIRLRLDAHDFVVKASVSGGDAPGKATQVELAPSTIYDFTKEQLGSNSTLKLPMSSFRYLHVKLSPGIAPDQVKGATINNLREQKASWIKAGGCGTAQTKGHKTEITCQLAPRVPLNRILFHVDPGQVNFRRSVLVADAKGEQVGSGEISRVRMNRAGTLVTDEQLGLNVGLWDTGAGALTVTVDNGDNPELTINSTEPQSLERRVYFDPKGKTALKLYYGDEKLAGPNYDYARFFGLDASPGLAELGPGAHNPQYTGRPDDRPWSERHMFVLWAAMILAVLALAFLALRGMRPAPQR